MNLLVLRFEKSYFRDISLRNKKWFLCVNVNAENTKLLSGECVYVFGFVNQRIAITLDRHNKEVIKWTIVKCTSTYWPPSLLADIEYAVLN